MLNNKLNFTLVDKLFQAIVIIILAFVVQRILKKIVDKLFLNSKKHKTDINKINTIKSLIKSIIKYVLLIIAGLIILNIFGIDTTALITGLGVLSLVVGLAFQDILKDILAGFSIIFEGQFRIGDYVKINDFYGTVSYIGLKTTRIKAYSGEVKIIANRNITEVTNYSLSNSLAVVDLSLAYEEDIEKVEKILECSKDKISGKIDNMIGEIELWGVEQLSDSSVVYRIVCKCKPAKHIEVQRKLRKELKKILDKNNIKIPYPQIEVHNEK